MRAADELPAARTTAGLKDAGVPDDFVADSTTEQLAATRSAFMVLFRPCAGQVAPTYLYVPERSQSTASLSSVNAFAQ